MVTNHNPASLIKVEQQDGRQVVSARELHSFMEVKTDFSDWCKRMFEYGFVENQDYSLLKIGERSAHNKIDYALTLSTAKEIAMLQRNEKGKQARQYFIECEKKAVALAGKPMDELDIMMSTLRQMKEQREELTAITEKQAEAQAYVEQVAKEPVRTMQVTTRKGVDAIVKNYALANLLDIRQVYVTLYQEFALRYRKNIKSNAIKAGMTQIGWVEANGYIGELYEVAKELFAQKGGICA